MAIPHGQQVESALTIPAGEKVTTIVGPGAIAAVIVQALDTDTVPLGTPLDVWVAPVDPNGVAYEDDIQLAGNTTSSIGGEGASTLAMIDLQYTPGTTFAVTVDNPDAVDHDVNINILPKG